MTSEHQSDAEVAIRRYIDFLKDPNTAVDTTKISSLEKELGSTTDTIKRLHLHGALEKARSADAGSIEAGFLKYARSYADANGFPMSTYLAEGVNANVLRLAEIGNARAAKAKGATVSEGRKRAPKVSKSTIRQHVLGLKKNFTLKDVMDTVGGSIGTVNSVVQELVEAGSVTNHGADTNHSGRGRAPMLYSVA